MKVGVHNAATGQKQVRDATPQEELAINGHWTGKASTTKGVVFVGDSNTTADYVPIASTYAHRTASALGLTYVNSAVSGQKAAAIVTNIQAQVFAHNPHNVVVMIGTNDADAARVAGTAVSTAVNAYIGSMRSFISAVRSAGKRLLVLSPPLSESTETNVYLLAMRDALRGLCVEQTVTMIDVTGQMQYLGTLGGTLLADCFVPSALDHYHLSAVGHAYIHDLILRAQIKAG